MKLWFCLLVIPIATQCWTAEAKGMGTFDRLPNTGKQSSNTGKQSSNTNVNSNFSPEISRAWEEHKKNYLAGKAINSNMEMNFLNNYRFVQDHNKNRNNNYKLRMNKFGPNDFTKQSTTGCFSNEQTVACPFNQKTSNVWRQSSSATKTSGVNKCPIRPSERSSIGQFCDWRLNPNVVSPVKDQGSCGSCWAFSAVTVLEGWLGIKHGTRNNISPQQLVDCLPRHCGGGNPETALKWINSYETRPESEERYPYKSQKNVCSRSTAKQLAEYHFKVEKVNAGDEEHLKHVVQNYGPVSVAVPLVQTFAFYSSGIYDDTRCSGKPGHAVNIIGFGHDEATNKDYWIVKNSWGDKWGEQGYIRIVRGQNLCGIACHGVYITDKSPTDAIQLKSGSGGSSSSNSGVGSDRSSSSTSGGGGGGDKRKPWTRSSARQTKSCIDFVALTGCITIVLFVL